MKNIKTVAATFAAGAAIAAASLLTVAAPASAATQPAVQQAEMSRTAAQHRPVQRRTGAPAAHQAGKSPQHFEQERRKAELQHEQRPPQHPQQPAGPSTDPGGFLPDPPVVTPEG